MGFGESPVVEPVHIFEGGVLDLVPVLPRRLLVDKFCLVEADHRFGEGVVVGVTDGADRR